MRLRSSAWPNGFDDVVVGARLEPEDGVGLAVERGEHDHRHDVVAVAQRAADLVAVGRPAQRDVEQHDVEVLRAGVVDRGTAVGDGQHAVPVAGERRAQGLAQRGLVVDDEDVQRLGGHRPGRP